MLCSSQVYHKTLLARRTNIRTICTVDATIDSFGRLQRTLLSIAESMRPMCWYQILGQSNLRVNAWQLLHCKRKIRKRKIAWSMERFCMHPSKSIWFWPESTHKKMALQQGNPTSQLLPWTGKLCQMQHTPHNNTIDSVWMLPTAINTLRCMSTLSISILRSDGIFCCRADRLRMRSSLPIVWSVLRLHHYTGPFHLDWFLSTAFGCTIAPVCEYGANVNGVLWYYLIWKSHSWEILTCKKPHMEMAHNMLHWMTTESEYEAITWSPIRLIAFENDSIGTESSVEAFTWFLPFSMAFISLPFATGCLSADAIVFPCILPLLASFA